MFRILFLASEVLLFAAIVLLLWNAIKFFLFDQKSDSVMTDAKLVKRNRKLEKEVDEFLKTEEK